MSHQNWLWTAYALIGLGLFIYGMILVKREEKKEKETKST
jgi:hypothetical protein